MGKLRYYYGCMNSLKSGTLLTKAYQFREAGCPVILLKPAIDTRDENMIHSRAIASSQPCYTFEEEENLFITVLALIKEICLTDKECHKVIVFVDEVNFITPQQVEELFYLTRINGLNIDVFAYGLKNTYQNELFEASKTLLTIADTIEEIKSMCSMEQCHEKATTHLRYIGDTPVFDGEELIVGDVHGEIHYESVCQMCWRDVYHGYK